MIFEGVKLMFVGMTTVMLFLGLMIYFINLVARLTKDVAMREVEAMKKERDLLAKNRKKVKETAVDSGDEDIAVIAAAVAAFEAERIARA